MGRENEQERRLEVCLSQAFAGCRCLWSLSFTRTTHSLTKITLSVLHAFVCHVACLPCRDAEGMELVGGGEIKPKKKSK